MACMIEELILASASPIRARLLAAAGVEARVKPAQIDEKAIKQVFNAESRSAGDCALALAESKARCCWSLLSVPWSSAHQRN